MCATIGNDRRRERDQLIDDSRVSARNQISRRRNGTTARSWQVVRLSPDRNPIIAVNIHDKVPVPMIVVPS